MYSEEGGMIRYIDLFVHTRRRSALREFSDDPQDRSGDRDVRSELPPIILKAST